MGIWNMLKTHAGAQFLELLEKTDPGRALLCPPLRLLSLFGVLSHAHDCKHPHPKISLLGTTSLDTTSTYSSIGCRNTVSAAGLVSDA